MGAETLSLKAGPGVFQGKKGFQPSANLRENLSISYELDGSVQIKGHLDLFDAGRSYETTFIGNLAEGSLETQWEEGDLMVLKLEAITFDLYNSENGTFSIAQGTQKAQVEAEKIIVKRKFSNGLWLGGDASLTLGNTTYSEWLGVHVEIESDKSTNIK